MSLPQLVYFVVSRKQHLYVCLSVCTCVHAQFYLWTLTLHVGDWHSCKYIVRWFAQVLLLEKIYVTQSNNKKLLLLNKTSDLYSFWVTSLVIS